MKNKIILLILLLFASHIGISQITTTPSSIAIGFETGAIEDDTLLVWDKSKGYMRSGYFDMSTSSIGDVGEFSHSFGYANIASGKNSFATGELTKASELNSTSLGWHTHAESKNSLAIGRYNKHYASVPLFSVGIGWDEAGRENGLIVTSSGRVGIGDVDPDSDLHLLHENDHKQDGFKIQNEGSAGYWRLWSNSVSDALGLFHSSDPNDPIGHFSDDGTYMSMSDERRKTNITDIEYGLESVMSLSPKKYGFKHLDNSQKNLGFIAQEVIELIPELVNHNEKDQYYVNYDGFGVVAIKAIQELKEIVDQQQVQIDLLMKLLEEK